MSRHALTISKAQARRFILHQQGLLGRRRYHGAQGALQFIRHAGSIQFDPLNVCGRNPDLTLQSRILDYVPAMLYDLLYRQRSVVDQFDKELCIFPVELWPHFARIRQLRGEWMRSHPQVAGARDAVLQAIREQGPLNSKALDDGGKVSWFWGASRLSRAVLEHLYYAGELGIHHKQGTVKHYDLIERLVPPTLVQAEDPHPDIDSLCAFMLKRRIGAVGLLWDKGGGALIGIPGFNRAAARQAAFAQLLADGQILPVQVEGLKDQLYMRTEDQPALEASMQASPEPRCELLAPLDPMLWDRALIRALFEFDFTWEVYVPAAKRKYGYYVLPLLLGERLIARAEPVYDRKARRMVIKGLWYEADGKPAAAVRRQTEGCLARFERFLHANAAFTGGDPRA